MFQPVRRYEPITDASGLPYQPRAYGELQPDGSWDGWLVFFPIPAGVVIATDRETTQNSYVNLVRWSATITPVYLQGALERAIRIQLEPAFRDRLAELSADDVEEELEMAAAEARTDADQAEREAEAHESAAAAARAEARERMADAQALEQDFAGAGGRRRTDRR
jgi:hypothetical protein